MATAEEYIINFASTADAGKVSDASKKIIKSIMKESGIFNVTITSTARTAYEQALVMYNNIVGTSVEDQKKLYGSSGDKIIDVYVSAKNNGKEKSTTISLMKAKIIELGAGKVSRHCADIDKLNVVDIAPSSIPADKKSAFEDAIKKESGVSKYIFPPTDPAYHIEIPQ